MKIFRVIWIEKTSEFPYEWKHHCIVCAENKEQAENFVLENITEVRKVRAFEVSIKSPRVIFHHVSEVE